MKGARGMEGTRGAGDIPNAHERLKNIKKKNRLVKNEQVFRCVVWTSVRRGRISTGWNEVEGRRAMDGGKEE